MDMSFTNRENISAWKRLWNTALTILALVFLVAYSLPAFIDDLSPNSNRAIDVIQWVSWLAIAIDLCVGLILAQNKKYFC